MQNASSTPLDFDRKNIPSDAGAGLTLAMVAIPDALASAILPGVNPIFALNAMMVGMPVAGLFTGSQFMNCALTSAMMLVVAGAVAGTAETDMVPLLVTLTILVGLFQLLLGILKLGRYAQQLQTNGGKLMLAGVGEHVLDQLRITETTETIPKEDIFMATDTLGGATLEALAAAAKWLEK